MTETKTEATDTLSAQLESANKALNDTKAKMSTYTEGAPKAYTDPSLPADVMAELGPDDLKNVLGKARAVARRGDLSQAMYEKLAKNMVASDKEYRTARDEAFMKDNFGGNKEEYDKYKALASKEFEGGLNNRELAMFKKIKGKLADEVVGGNSETGIPAGDKSGNDNLQFNKAALSADKKKLNYVFDGDKYEVEVEKLRGHFLETVKRLPIDKRPAYVEFTENVIDKAVAGK